MRRGFLSLVILVVCVNVYAQDFSNKGKDFWLGYAYHVRYVTNGTNGVNGQDMVLYFATENIPNTFTNIKIEIPALGYVQNITNVASGSIVTSQPIPKSGAQDARLTVEGLFNSGIHVTATRPVVAYAHIFNGNVSGATLLFPTNTLGKEYYSINYKQVSNEDFSNSFFFVVATDTGTTTVEITPSANTQSHNANTAFTVTLQQGEIYNVMGELYPGSPGDYTGADLTGSKIKSVSSGGIGCKKIAVFCGAGKSKISCGTANSSDNLFAQAFPKSAWGKRFLTSPTADMPFNYYRIGVSDPATVVKLNGVVQTGLISNFYYDFPLTNKPLLIEADQPVMVAQYITTANTCGNTAIGSNGDPEMIYLSPVEQTVDEAILNSTPNADITEHWINVVIKTSSVPSFSVTGTAASYSFQTHPQDAAYSYAQIRVTAGAHTLKADSGFNAIAYGYGNAESYGYNAGTNLKDLYNFIAPLNPLNISGTNTACACTPFFYTITYPFQPLSLYWDFKGIQTPDVSINNPVADSTYLLNGKQVWRYKIATPYTYCPSGNYPLAITAGTAGTDGCGNTQTKEDTIFVKNPPVVDFKWTHNGCVSDSVRFADSSLYDTDTYSYKWFWDFGDGTKSNLHNPAHKYAAAGTYTVTFNMISNVGCISNTGNKDILVTNEPVASFTVSSPLCLNKPVTFTDQSTTPGAAIKTWYWDFGDGKKDTLKTNSQELHSYQSAAGFTAKLVVAMATGCASAPFLKTLTVNSNPLADFTLPTAVCLPYESAKFTDASAGTGNIAINNWNWHFGEPSSGINDSAAIQNPAHLYSGQGPFSIKLIVTNTAGCTDDTTKVLKNIYLKPTAVFTATAANCLNVATAFSSTTSAGQGNTIANWFWNYGDASAIGSGQTNNYTYSAAGTYQVTHYIKTDKGCYSDTATKPVIIHPLPVPNFTTATPACEKNNITFTPTANIATGSIAKWTWNFGNGRPDSVISNGNPFTYTYPSAGTYTVKLSVESDKGCVNTTAITKSVVVNVLPKPGFISPEVCLSDASAIFTDTSKISAGTIASWSWNFGDPGSGATNISALQNATHRYNSIGNYTAKLIVVSNAGCVDSLLQTFTVNGDVPKANFTVQNQPGYCGSDSAIIVNASTVNFGNVTKVVIYWDNAGSPAVAETDELPTPGKIYKHRYTSFQSPASKQFFIRYVAYSGATCLDQLIQPVTIYAMPKTQFTSIPFICLDATTYQLTQGSETGGVAGSGTYTGPGINGAGVFTPATVGPGIYKLKYTFISPFGCTDSSFQNITVLAPATANFGSSKPACETKPVSFTDSSSIPAASGTIAQWSWSFGDGSAVVVSTTATPVTHTFTTSGSYTVSLTITTSNGCKVTRQKTVLLNPQPAPNFTFPASICLPDATAILTDASTIKDGTENAFTYLWNFDDAASISNSSVSKNPSHRFTVLRTYNVSLQVTSGAGCVQSVTRAVNTLHPQPTAAFSSDSVSLCQNQSVRFTDNSTGADGTVNGWNWDFGNGRTAGIQVPGEQIFTTSGVFNISLEITNSFGCRDTATKPFTVYAYPVISAGPDRVLLQGGEVTIIAQASGNGLQYLWSPVRYLNNTRILQPLVKGLTEDEIIYTLTATGTGNCRISDDVKVTLLKAPVIPNTFTPNGDGINEHWTILYLDTYPDCRIQVFNRNGQPVFESRGYKAPGWDGTYNGKPVPFGTYYYVIEPGSGRKPITGYVTVIK